MRAGGVISLEEVTKVETTTSKRAPINEVIPSPFSDATPKSALSNDPARFKLERKVVICFSDRPTVTNKLFRLIYKIFLVFY